MVEVDNKWASTWLTFLVICPCSDFLFTPTTTMSVRSKSAQK